MPDTAQRLDRCFAAVFPEVGDTGIRKASVENTAAWDSVRTATLLAVIEEEFGVSVPMDDIEALTSYTGVLEYLERA